MYELKKAGKLFTSKFVGTEPSSYEKRIYRVTVSQRLRNAAVEARISVTIE
jgi:citrate lyase synthetase